MNRVSVSIGAFGLLLGFSVVAHAGAPLVLASRSAAAPTPSIREQDVYRWLSDVQGAWERRDAATLVNLGVVTSAHEQHLTRALAGYRTLHVSLTNVDVSVEADRAFVSYDRTDSDETGKELHHPRRTFELHRVAPGQLAVAQAHTAHD